MATRTKSNTAKRSTTRTRRTEADPRQRGPANEGRHGSPGIPSEESWDVREVVRRLAYGQHGAAIDLIEGKISEGIDA